MHERIDILGVQVSAVNLESAAAEIISWTKDKHKKRYVCVAPVSTLVDCNRDARYKAVINTADMVTPDGMPVVWLLCGKKKASAGRVYGPDLLRRLCAEEGLRHYFFGATDTVLNQLEQCLKKGSLGINIVGKLAPAFRQEAVIEDKAVIGAINQASADILWVGLGSPKQDFWMKLNRDHLNVPVIIGVGAAFDFVAGVKPQAPYWIQRSGFEWLFRLCTEPRRLWKRYLIGNSLFLVYLIKSMFKSSGK